MMFFEKRRSLLGCTSKSGMREALSGFVMVMKGLSQGNSNMIANGVLHGLRGLARAILIDKGISGGESRGRTLERMFGEAMGVKLSGEKPEGIAERLGQCDIVSAKASSEFEMERIDAVLSPRDGSGERITAKIWMIDGKPLGGMARDSRGNEESLSDRDCKALAEMAKDSMREREGARMGRKMAPAAMRL